jgi:hypothetical protein
MPDGSQKRVTERHLIEAFAKVIREDHSNPNREKCPDPLVIQEMAASPADEILIDEATLNHIGHCWPCLSDLKRLRHKRKS